jgi:glycosyltransferase involved in cell wall biosynthesis
VRIAFYAPRASYLKPGLSGDLVFVRSLLDGLEERGHELQVVSRRDVRDFVRRRASVHELVTEARSIRQLTKRFAPDAWLVYGASMKHPDLFGWWQHPRRYVLIATALSNAQRVPRPWRAVFRFAHRSSLRRADRVVAYRPKSRDDLRSAGVSEERLSVLPLAIATWNAVPFQEAARHRLGLPLDAPVVLCVSRLTAPKEDGSPWKTEMVLQVVSAVAAASRDVVLLLVGDGPGRERVEARAAELGLEERVRLAGEVAHEELPSYFAACDLFALPDLRDFPFLAILEAQACGRPVLTMNTAAARLTVAADSTGVLANDIEEFGTRLRELTQDRARCRRMGEAGPAYIARFHTLSVRLDQIEDMLAPGV